MLKYFVVLFIFLLGIKISLAQTGLPYGINLAGPEFGHNYPGTVGQDYIYPTNSMLEYYSGKGFKLIRLPISWERVQPTLNGEVNMDEVNRILDVLDWAKALDMKVIIDLHNYCRRSINGTEQIIGSSSLSIAHIKDGWTKIAEQLKTRSNIYGYGIMNEPHDMLSSTPWFNIAQEIIYGIRSTDLNTTIIVGGDSWSSAERWIQYSSNLKDLVDVSDDLIFEAHVYFDNDASGRYTSSYAGEGAHANTGVNRVKPFVDWLNDYGLRGFVGEYGIPGDDPQWEPVLTNFMDYLSANCVNGTYWAGGQWWGAYKLSVEPSSGVDKPQMAILENYLSTAYSACDFTSTTSLSRIGVKAFPNPFEYKLSVQITDFKNVKNACLFDINGKKIFSQRLTGYTTSIEVENLTRGVYFLTVTMIDNSVFIRKVVKK